MCAHVKVRTEHPVHADLKPFSPDGCNVKRCTSLPDAVDATALRWESLRVLMDRI